MTWFDNLSEVQVARISSDMDKHGAHAVEYARGDRPFAVFLFVADIGCRRSLGVSIFDLADYLWRDAFDGEMSPSQALADAIRADGIEDQEPPDL